MSRFMKGNVSYTSFKAERQPDSITEIKTLVEKYAFQLIQADDVRDESIGWVDPLLSFENEQFSNLLFRDFVLLSMRMDKYSFGASQIRPFLEEEEFNFKQANKLEYIPAQQKKELREKVIKRMRKKSLPKTAITEASWDSSNNTIFLFSQSSAVIAKFVDLFEKTFGFSLQQLSIVDMAENAGELEPIFGKLWSAE